MNNIKKIGNVILSLNAFHSFTPTRNDSGEITGGVLYVEHEQFNVSKQDAEAFLNDPFFTEKATS